MIIKTGVIKEGSINKTGHFVEFILMVIEGTHKFPLYMLIKAVDFNEELLIDRSITVECDVVPGHEHYRVYKIEPEQTTDTTTPQFTPFEKELLGVLRELVNELKALKPTNTGVR